MQSEYTKLTIRVDRWVVDPNITCPLTGPSTSLDQSRLMEFQNMWSTGSLIARLLAATSSTLLGGVVTDQKMMNGFLAEISKTMR